MPCYGFSRSLLWQLVFTVVKYGPLLLWHMIPQKSPPHMSFILAFWKDSWVSRKALILTACSAKQVRCPSFSIGSDASYVSGTVYSLQTILFLRNLCRLTFLLQIANRSDTWTYQVLHALQDFPTPQQFLNAIRSREAIKIKQFELTLREGIIGSWRELDNLTPHDNHHLAELWRLITHILVNLWGLLLAGGMTEKEITSLCYLSIFAWIFSTFPAVHFLAFAFLVITFWSKESVMTGIEGLMSSGSVTNVPGTLFRMRNTFCWTAVRMNILLAFAHSTASWSSHLSMRIAQLVWGHFWTDICGVASFLAECLAFFPWFVLISFWFGFRLFPSFRSDAPQRHI